MATDTQNKHGFHRHSFNWGKQATEFVYCPICKCVPQMLLGYNSQNPEDQLRADWKADDYDG